VRVLVCSALRRYSFCRIFSPLSVLLLRTFICTLVSYRTPMSSIRSRMGEHSLFSGLLGGAAPPFLLQ